MMGTCILRTTMAAGAAERRLNSAGIAAVATGSGVQVSSRDIQRAERILAQGSVAAEDIVEPDDDEVEKLREENRKLRDEVARLKKKLGDASDEGSSHAPTLAASRARMCSSLARGERAAGLRVREDLSVDVRLARIERAVNGVAPKGASEAGGLSLADCTPEDLAAAGLTRSGIAPRGLDTASVRIDHEGLTLEQGMSPEAATELLSVLEAEMAKVGE